jgi:hypothetical protein
MGVPYLMPLVKLVGVGAISSGAVMALATSPLRSMLWLMRAILSAKAAAAGK